MLPPRSQVARGTELHCPTVTHPICYGPLSSPAALPQEHTSSAGISGPTIMAGTPGADHSPTRTTTRRPLWHACCLEPCSSAVVERRVRDVVGTGWDPSLDRRRADRRVSRGPSD